MHYQAQAFDLTTDLVKLDMDKVQFERVKTDKSICALALEFEEKFALLIDNFAELEFDLLRLAETHLIWPTRSHERAMQHRLLLNRRIVNLLTASRLYLDQSDHALSQAFGSGSGELAAAKDFKRSIYDAHLGYRFMEALRNHVQHAALPVDIITLAKSGVGGAPQRVHEWYVQHTIKPQVKIRALRENRSFKQQVLNELQPDMNDSIDLRRPVREYISCLVEIHANVRTVIAEKVRAARRAYGEAIEEIRSRIRTPNPIWLAEIADDGTAKDEVHLVTEFLDYYDSLFKKNAVSSNLQRSVASNTDQQPD